MQRHVDGQVLAGVSSAVLVGRELVDEFHCGWADREARVPLRHDHLFRVFSNTKLITSCVVLQLWEQGRLGLDDPIAEYIPALGHRQVLRRGATHIHDTEPAHAPITIRQLLSHSAGLGYGLLDPGTVLYQAYAERQVLSPHQTLAQMIDALAPLPLSYQPGSGWEYSVALDVLARLVEVVCGRSFGDVLQQQVFDPLAMHDTGFVVPPEQQHRLATVYAGANLLDPRQGGLTRTDNFPYPLANRVPMPRQSGGAGLVSSLADTLSLLRALLPGGPTLLKPATLALMMRNQLPPGRHIGFPTTGTVPGRGHGLGGAVTVQPWVADPSDTEGDFQWGGIAGTHWWISPRNGVAGVVMTQRQMGFWNPFWFEFKALMRQATSG
ncbi:MAG: beta-lactamase family protein [Burkholderiales bacterium]|nr:beta-lactamase family protein [Burkholderiales bacterium]